MMEFKPDIFNIFQKDWALLTVGAPGRFNTMTICWGGLGTLWQKPVATVYVKPIRYTHDFMEKSDRFTVSFYGKEYRQALTLLGTLSGRDGDKVSQAGLTPRALDGAVTFAEAELTIVCRKIYAQELDIAAMPEDVGAAFYNTEAAHTMYIGEVVDILR